MTSPTDIEAIRGRVTAWRPRRGTSEDFVRDDARSLLAALDAVIAERDRLNGLSETLNAVALEKDRQLNELRAKFERLNLKYAEATDRKGGG